MSLAKEFTVVKDSREQQGYDFEPYDGGTWICNGMVLDKLETGDYTIQGLEDKLCIERKASTVEMAVNFGNDKPRFMEEIARMDRFPHKFLVLEFSLNELLAFPKGAGLPPHVLKRVRTTGDYLLRSLTELQTKHNVHVMYCGDKYHAFRMTGSILKRINDLYR